MFVDANKPWDYIIIADCTYKKASWPDLISCIVHLSSSNTKTILAMEPRNVGEVEGVLKEAERQGLKWKEEKLPIDANVLQCSLSCARAFTLSKI